MLPILFNILANLPAILIARDKENCEVEDLIVHVADGGASNLQHADDTIILMEPGLGKEVI